jgi:hypothetical protein
MPSKIIGPNDEVTNRKYFNFIWMKGWREKKKVGLAADISAEWRYSGISFRVLKVQRSLYIEKRKAYTRKGDREKIYLACYPALGKKETSCKEIRVSSTKLKF